MLLLLLLLLLQDAPRPDEMQRDEQPTAPGNR
jgi:hypothetical protein